jgi:hypothetical protein
VHARALKLSSLEIASLLYHAVVNALRPKIFCELGILTEVQRHLDALYSNPDHAKRLKVPDGSRVIIDDTRSALMKT